MALTLGLVATACGSDADDGATAGSKVKLTVATFNEFGCEDLIEEYNAMQDDVVVEQKNVGTWATPRTTSTPSWRRARASPTSRRDRG